MNNPTISVVMSAYNAEKTIKRAIQSILSQTFTDFEFIIINDGSTDNTLDTIKSFADNRIVLINKPQNQGLVSALNDGIKQAKGKYIARMDADDESLPNRFALQVEFLNKNPDIGVIGTTVFKIKNGKKTTRSRKRNHQQCLDKMVKNTCFAHPSTMLRKSVFDVVSYDTNYLNAEDYKLWVDLAKQGIRFANLATPLLNYYIHGDNIGVKKRKQQRLFAAMAREEYILFYLGDELGHKYSQVLSFVANNSNQTVSLKKLNDFYQAIYNKDKHKAKVMCATFRLIVKKNIHLISYNFEFVGLKFLTYYLQYKIKSLFKKS